jgi:hypothetical protein
MQARHRSSEVRPRRSAIALLVVACACGFLAADGPRPIQAHSRVSQAVESRLTEAARAHAATRTDRYLRHAFDDETDGGPSVDPTAAVRPTEQPRTKSTSKPPAKSRTTPTRRSTPKPPSPDSAPNEKVITTAYITGYSYYDNTPPGSASIAYPGTRHDVAAGTGSYDDPITLAVGWHRTAGPQWPVGSRFYLPFLRKYVIVEDQCGDEAEDGPCYQLDEAAEGATTWIDVWVGGQGQSKRAADDCMGQITALHTVVYRPAKDYPVNQGDITTACSRDQLWSEAVPPRASS